MKIWSIAVTFEINSFILLLGDNIAFIDPLRIPLIRPVWDIHETLSRNITNNFPSRFLTNRFYGRPQTITLSNLSTK